jgi:hypothetical protein
LGLTADPVPARVDGYVKAGLLHQAADQGWSLRRACALLGLDDLCAARWHARQDRITHDDLPPGGHPVHALLDSERASRRCVGCWPPKALWAINHANRSYANRGGRSLRRPLAQRGDRFETGRSSGRRRREPRRREHRGHCGSLIVLTILIMLGFLNAGREHDAAIGGACVR